MIGDTYIKEKENICSTLIGHNIVVARTLDEEDFMNAEIWPQKQVLVRALVKGLSGSITED